MKKQAPALSYRLILKQFSIQSILFIFLFGVVLSFQNCGGPVPSESLSSQGENAPLAFESQMDQIAYMSCSNITNTSSHFSFKVGAYNSPAGLRYRSAFKSAVAGLSSSDIISVLQASPINAGSQQQLAIRSVAKLQDTINSIVGAFPTALSESSIAGALSLSGTAYTSNFANQPLGYQHIEAQIGYGTATTTEDTQLAIRTIAVSGGVGILATTFSSGTSTSAAAASASTAYGHGYALTFSTPVGFTGMPAKIISSVQERNLENNQVVPGTWDCNSNYVFKIIRAVDRNGPDRACANAGVDVPGGGTQALVYNTIRDMLPKQYWLVDAVNRCIVAKPGAGSCYGSNDTTPTGTTLNPPTNPAVGTVKYTGGACIPGSRTCPHYLSVCKRL